MMSLNLLRKGAFTPSTSNRVTTISSKNTSILSAVSSIRCNLSATSFSLRQTVSPSFSFNLIQSRSLFDSRRGDSSSFHRGGQREHSSKDARDIFKDLFDDLSDSSQAPVQQAEDMSRYAAAKVEVQGKDVPEPINTFSDLNFDPKILRNLTNMGYKEPIPVQKYSLPIINSKRDLMSCAQTGSGKTAAFLLPIINSITEMKNNPRSSSQKNETPRLQREERGFGRSFSKQCEPYALIVAPTRELVQQILNEAHKFTAGTRIKAAACFGGAPAPSQLERLHGSDILVVTPGRYTDFVNRGSIDPSNVKFLVLDEADRMLDIGFGPAIQQMVAHPGFPTKEDRQTLLFSATFPKEIQSLARNLLKPEHLFLTVGRIGSATELVRQNFIQTENIKDKEQSLLDLLQDPACGKTLVFCQTKSKVDEVGYALNSLRIPSATIHGDFSQSQRNHSIRKFISGEAQVLVATDVAARGLDIKDVSTVVNFDLPNEIDDYVHRIGRTGRAGKTGKAYSMVSKQDGKIVSELIEVAKEAKNEIPEWMYNVAPYSSGKKGGSRFGGKSSFGGRPYNSNSFGGDRSPSFNRDSNRDFGRDRGSFNRDSNRDSGRDSSPRSREFGNSFGDNRSSAPSFGSRRDDRKY